MAASYLQGFTLTGGLILAIGAQNAHVLKMGITRQHVFPTVAICALSDALLIGLGILGMGACLDRWPQAVQVVTWAGAAFLFWYAFNSLRAAFTRRSLTLDEARQPISLRKAVLLILAFTYLNPHAYLDTLVLIGAVGAHLPTGERLPFWLGCITASLTWFTLLGYGSARLARVFARPESWRVLDGVIGVSMGWLAWGLVH